jgi:hypothetical protein
VLTLGTIRKIAKYYELTDSDSKKKLPDKKFCANSMAFSLIFFCKCMPAAQQIQL